MGGGVQGGPEGDIQIELGGDELRERVHMPWNVRLARARWRI